MAFTMYMSKKAKKTPNKTTKKQTKKLYIYTITQLRKIWEKKVKFLPFLFPSGRAPMLQHHLHNFSYSLFFFLLQGYKLIIPAVMRCYRT